MPNRLLAALVALPLLVGLPGCTHLLRGAHDEAAAAESHTSVRLPEPTRIVLPNGMTMLVVYRPNLPIVSMNVVVRAGAAVDPEGKAGLADLTAGLLRRGTARRTAPEIAEAIDSVGGALSAGAGADTASVFCNVLTKDVDLGVNLLSDVVLHPAFDPKELARAREEAEAGLKSALDDANEVVAMGLKRAVLGGHPYGRAATLTSLKSITTSDIRAFYQRHYIPNEAIVSVVGDLTPDAARQKFAAAFAGWQPAFVRDANIPPVPAVQGRHVILIDMDVNQSFVQLGHAGVKRNNPDYFPLMVMNFILGGDFTSRLNMSIRDRQGLAYGAGSGFSMMRDAGYFRAYLNTRTATTAKALESLIVELKGIQDKGVTDDELRTAKAYLTGAFPLRFETNEQLASEIVNQQIYGLPADYLATYRDHVLAVTAEDVQRVARTYLHPGDYDLVVVTKAAAVKDQLGAFGTVETWPKERLIQ